MAESKFNLFGPPRTSDIRVGYISTDRGYVPNVSICEANSYAKLNPGTTFIIKNRKRIEYKNINEVNRLQPKDVFVEAPAQGQPLDEGSKDACGGINLEKPYGPPRAEFYGGGGVGVKGNVVVGKNGGVLGIHLVSGGHGYQYPPLVRIKDGGGGKKGGGVVAIAGLGQTAIVKEVYDAEDEFEEYFPNNTGVTVEGLSIKEFCEANDNKKGVGDGRRYSPHGKDLGPWDPSMYVNDEKDPIKRQIAEFQEYLNALTDPWWFTRKEAPLQVVSDSGDEFSDRQKKLKIDPNRTVYPVHHHDWGGSLLKHGTVEKKPTPEGTTAFEEEVFEIYTEGGGGKDLFFTFTEVDGKHTFTIKADDYTDGGEPRKITKQIKPNVEYKVTSDGRYKKKKGTIQGLLKKSFGQRGRDKGFGTSSSIFAEVIGTRHDKDDLQILATVGRFRTRRLNRPANRRRGSRVNTKQPDDLLYKMTVPETKGKVSSSQDNNTRKVAEIARSFMNDHAISPVPMSNAPGSDFAGMLFTMEWEEEFPFPGEYTFKGQCDNVASAYLDGQQLMPKVAYYRDKPTIVKKHLNWDGKEGKVHKLRIDLLNSLQYKDLVVQEPPQKDTTAVKYEEISTATAKFEGTKLNDIFLVVTGEGTANAEIKLQTNDRWNISDLALRELKCGDIKLTRTKGRKRETLTGSGKFTAGRHKVEIIGSSKDAGARIGDTKIEIDDDATGGFDVNATLMLKVLSVDPAKRRILAPAKPKTSSEAAGIKVQKVFNTVDWMGKANRQLWRANVYGRGGFVNTAGVTPFDTAIHLDTNPYAGTHPITWKNINFPIDGNYTITVAVDDSVNLRFHGPGGDVSIRKEGFINNDGSLPTGKSTYTRFFKKGMYTLDADLEQIPGGKFSYKKVGKNDRVLEKEVNFNVKVAGHYGNKITIPGLFSLGKEHISAGGSSVRENFVKNVEIGKEYDVIITSIREEGGAAETTHRKGAIRLRNKSGKLGSSGSKLEFEDKLEGVGTAWNWDLIQALASEGRFYGVHGNKCKFKIEDNFKTTNTMVLAVDVEVAYATKTVVSARSWQENPMGVAFTIKAPTPPVPVEEPPKQKGRCPNNPMWTTRFPSEDKSKPWYPVRMDKESAKRFGHPGKGWSPFLNRWAISPALPLNTPGTDEGGKIFTNTWKVDIPYDGYYQIKGEVDDIGRYYINDDLKLDLSRRMNKVHGASKFFLKAGLKTVRVEVENYSTFTYKNVSKKVFSARDWRRQPPVAPPPSSPGGILCHAGGGRGGTDNTEQLIGGKVIVGKGGDGGKGGDDNEFDSHHGGNGGGAGLRSGGNARNPITHSQLDSMSAGRYKGGAGGFGVNFEGTAVGNMTQTLSKEQSSGGDGVSMGGGGGGNCRGGKSGSGGDGGVKIVWGLTGKSQTWTTPGVYNVTVPGNIGKAGTVGKAPSVTAKFEGTNINDLHLVVSGTGTCECTLLLDTNDNWKTSGLSVREVRCGDIILTRTKGKKFETLTGTGTFVGGRRYKVMVIGASRGAGARIVSSTVSGHTSASLFQREKLSTQGIADTRIELDDDVVNSGFDRNASINLRVSPGSQPMDGVTIICIGGGGSGHMDAGGDYQGSGGSGGAYAWVNEDVESGKKLKIVVGKGGKGKDVQGSSRGTDSYVQVVVDPPPPNDLKIIKQQQGKVTYSGPNLFHFVDKRWGKVMNKFGVSPANVDADLDKPTSDNVGTKTLEWKNVDFPFKGQYDVLFAADNKASLYINGEQLLYADENYTLGSDKSYDKINIGNPGRYDVKIELFNAYHENAANRVHANDDVFRHNPSGVVLEIRKDVNVKTSEGKSWTQNPMGISGVLIPPPCPKETGGKGIVTEVIINDPGTGFTDPGPQPPNPEYPIVPVIKKVLPPDTSINVDCSKDPVRMKPDLGYKFKPVCDNFGRVTQIITTPPPQLTPVPFVPEIWIDSGTGFASPLQPVFDFIIPPPDILPPEDIIQVTDLAGIKQTGYYNGKPYYGAVFYENGIKYAGWYATAGQPIQIYDTMQESIDAQVTTPPSAIQRQGSDVTSNDPRLNIPGTPENLT